MYFMALLQPSEPTTKRTPTTRIAKMLRPKMQPMPTANVVPGKGLRLSERRKRRHPYVSVYTDSEDEDLMNLKYKMLRSQRDCNSKKVLSLILDNEPSSSEDETSQDDIGNGNDIEDTDVDDIQNDDEGEGEGELEPESEDESEEDEQEDEGEEDDDNKRGEIK
ncbi:ATPase family AAA domain-containing protein At1g05910-like [Momordica charantia]|uniref:ATPase family AAA domain-containing protein At1g05910-like n=1 Tax=Momordica charantia TaxID=3673 RepID=A0A6J1D8E6_MOMCH|nr:ATPase family AAA domain-containing protein At1g05910-like [Momordica charantia]